jgi:predicted metal-binding protein
MMEEFSEESEYVPLPIIDEASPPDLEEAERFLDIFVRAGVIAETDKWIILGSKIVGQPLREIAGVPESYQKIKKRRQRALHEMEKYLERKRMKYAMKEGVGKEEIPLADVLKRLFR